jgi:hypothetical protein
MSDIRNSVQIDVPPAQVYPLVSSASGFSKWWAQDVTLRPDETVDLGFFNRATVYSLQLVRPATPSEAEWLCLNSKEWKGTRLLFRLNESKGQTLLRFTHANLGSRYRLLYFLQYHLGSADVSTQGSCRGQGSRASVLYDRLG